MCGFEFRRQLRFIKRWIVIGYSRLFPFYCKKYQLSSFEVIWILYSLLYAFYIEYGCICILLVELISLFFWIIPTYYINSNVMRFRVELKIIKKKRNSYVLRKPCLITSSCQVKWKKKVKFLNILGVFFLEVSLILKEYITLMWFLNNKWMCALICDSLKENICISMRFFNRKCWERLKPTYIFKNEWLKIDWFFENVAGK